MTRVKKRRREKYYEKDDWKDWNEEIDKKGKNIKERKSAQEWKEEENDKKRRTFGKVKAWRNRRWNNINRIGRIKSVDINKRKEYLGENDETRVKRQESNDKKYDWEVKTWVNRSWNYIKKRMTGRLKSKERNKTKKN